MSSPKYQNLKHHSAKTLFNHSFMKNQVKESHMYQTHYFESLGKKSLSNLKKRQAKKRNSQNQLNISVKIKNLNINNFNKQENRQSHNSNNKTSIKNNFVSNLLKNQKAANKQNQLKERLKIQSQSDQQFQNLYLRPQTSKLKLSKFKIIKKNPQSIERIDKKPQMSKLKQKYFLQQNDKKPISSKGKKIQLNQKKLTSLNSLSKNKAKRFKFMRDKNQPVKLTSKKINFSIDKLKIPSKKDTTKSSPTNKQIISFSFIKELCNIHKFYLQFLDIVQQNKIDIAFLENFEKQIKKKKFYLEKIIDFKVFEKLFKENFILEKWVMLSIYFSISSNPLTNSNFVRISLILYQTFIFFLNILDTQLKKNCNQQNIELFEDFIKVNIIPKNNDFYVFKIKSKEMKQFLQKSKQELIQFLEQQKDVLKETEYILKNFNKLSHNDNHKKLDKVLYLQLSQNQKNEQNFLKNSQILLPSKTSQDFQYTLILDLDETLVHFPTKDSSDQILLRPFLKHFLKETSKYYELIIFTASQKEYADWIIDRIDLNKLIKHRLYRDHVTEKDGVILKDLNLLGRDLSKCIIIDNQSSNFSKHPENGLEITTWTGNPQDQELLELIPFLKSNLKRNSLKEHTRYQRVFGDFEKTFFLNKYNFKSFNFIQIL